MYYLVFILYHAYGLPATTQWRTGSLIYSDNRILVSSKAECEQRRDALLAQWSPVGKPSGPVGDPYVTDAWCFEKTQFDKDNHMNGNP